MLLAGQVKVRRQTIAIPSNLAGQQQVNNNGQTITVKPGGSTKPSYGGGKGHKGAIFGAIGGIVGGATTAAGSIGSIGKGVADFAAGVGGAAGGLAAPISKAIGDVNNVVSSLHGVQDAFPNTEISKAGLDVFSGTLNIGRQCLDKMKSFSGILPGFENMPAAAQQAAKSTAAEFCKPGGLLDQVSVSSDHTTIAATATLV